jgi:hypothetical protein
MQITVDRGSVCAGDETAPHHIYVQLPDDATLEDALEAVTRRGFPGFRSWLVCTRRDRSGPLAAIRTGRSLAFEGYVGYVAFIADQNARLRDLIGTHDDAMLYYVPQEDRDPEEVRAEHLAEAHLPLTQQVLQLPRRAADQ